MVVSSSVVASSPYDTWGYDAPIDSVVVWFHDYCNQHQQARAFWHIIVTDNWTWAFEPFAMAQIKPEYDTPEVRNAFEFFVRSLTVDNQSANCGIFYPDLWLGRGPDTTKAWDSEAENSLCYVLSLYMNLGFTASLYDIADSLVGQYGGFEPTGYWPYLWNRLGLGYFQHLMAKTQNEPNFVKGIWIAQQYLREFKSPSIAVRNEALSIIHYGATSPSQAQRYDTANFISDVYVNGYPQLRDEVEGLLADQDENVMKMMRMQIRTMQQYKHQMMDFLRE